MNGLQLLNIVNSDFKLRNIVKGVYPSNELPNYVFTYPSAYIINTQPSYMKGEHWLCVWFDSNIYSDFLDTFGNDPFAFDNNIRTFLESNTMLIRHSEKILQAENSEVCGYYVLLYLILKSRGHSLNDVISIFGNNKQMNDCLAVEFVSSNIDV